MVAPDGFGFDVGVDATLRVQPAIDLPLRVVAHPTRNVQPQVEVRHSAAGNAVVVVDHRVLAFTRTGAMTVPATEVVEDVCRDWLRTRGPAVGVVAVVHEGTSMPVPALVERHRALVHNVARSDRFSVAFVVRGNCLQATLMRAAMRTFTVNRPMVQLFDDVDRAASWLAPRVGLHADRLHVGLDVADAEARHH
jgi:hypothetical protein